MKTNNTLGDTIRSLRKRAKMTQEELADGICSPVSISRIENGIQMPSGNVLDAILEKLGASTYQLCRIYYKTDRQISFEQESQKIAELLRTEQLTEAKILLNSLKNNTGGDNHNLQCYLLMSAAIRIEEKAEASETIQMLRKAILLTRPSFDETDFRNLLLTVQEANILNELMAALFQDNQPLKAIHIGEELIFSLKKNQSSLSEFRVMQINANLLLSQILETEHRYNEALLYCQEAETISLSGTEQIMLPEIEFIKASLYHAIGQDDASIKIIKAILPYMDLISKKESAESVRNYAKIELGIEL